MVDRSCKASKWLNRIRSLGISGWILWWYHHPQKRVPSATRALPVNLLAHISIPATTYTVARTDTGASGCGVRREGLGARRNAGPTMRVQHGIPVDGI
jgi:hypothetical protein